MKIDIGTLQTVSFIHDFQMDKKCCKKCGTVKELFHLLKCPSICTNQKVDSVVSLAREFIPELLECSAKEEWVDTISFKSIREVTLDSCTLDWIDNMLKTIKYETDTDTKCIKILTVFLVLTSIEPLFSQIISNKDESTKNSTCPMCAKNYEECHKECSNKTETYKALLKKYIFSKQSAEDIDSIELTHISLAMFAKMFELLSQIPVQCVLDSIGDFFIILHKKTALMKIVSDVDSILGL